MRKVILAGAAAALLWGGAAVALTPTQIAADIAAGTITIVNMTGSSAFRDEGLLALSVLCQAGTMDAYGSDASFADAAGISRNSWDGYDPSGAAPFYSYNGPDFRGYSCTLKNPVAAGTPALVPLAGTDVLVYYRAEGGSVYGPAPIALNAKSQRLTIPNPAAVPAGQGACSNTTQVNGTALVTLTKSGFNLWICPVPSPILNTSGKSGPASDPGTAAGWWLPYDNWVNNATNKGTLLAFGGNVDLVLDTTTLGVSDVEPVALSGKNYPVNDLLGDGTSLSTALTPAQLANLNSTPVLQQMFGVIVNNSAASLVTKNLTNLSKQTVTGILTGKYTNWNQTPEGGGVNAAITICRRDPGSGTQTVTSILYGNVWCGSASSLESAIQMKAGNGTTVLQYATTGDVQECVGSTNDAIGVSVFGGNPPGGKFVSIDGVAMTQANLLNGQWPQWEEVNYMKSVNFTTLFTANQQALVNGLIQGVADSTVGAVAAAAGYAYIPNQTDATAPDNSPTIANLAHFVNVVTKKGNSCNVIMQPLNVN